MSMTREDVLRELELLPVWQLRAPVAPQTDVAQVTIEIKAVETMVIPQASPAIAAKTSHYVLVSDKEKWAFVLPEALGGTENTLFNNILLALKLNKTHSETLTDLSVKVIVAMGERVAQQLLSSVESIEQLRGKVHVYQGVPLIVTYHPSDLLQQLSTKAKTWDDLCIANQIAST